MKSTARPSSKQLLLSFLALLFASVSVLFQNSAIAGTVTNVSVKTAHEATKDNKVQLIDVREINEFKEVAAPQAKNFPLSGLSASSFESASGLGKEDVIYIICRSGNRSMKAATLLKDAGYKKLYNVTGGMLDWEAQGLPVKP